MAVRFVPESLVVRMHADLLARYGGRPGLRDPHLLASALAQPMMTVGGRFVHRTIFEKAAAYGYHVCRNHPFIDGNKRVAFVLMDVFLQRNGWELGASEEAAYAMMESLASGTLTRPLLSLWLRQHSRKLPPR